MVRTAVIPAAGWGTRLLPASKSVPKPMLPLADLPAIHYIVEEAALAGIERIVLITGRNTGPLEDYFYENPELTRILKDKGAHEILEKLELVERKINVTFIRQGHAGGLGHAVLQAREVVGNEPFAVLFPDDLIVNDKGPSCLRQIIDVYEQCGDGCVLSAMNVTDAEVSRYGIVGGDPISPRLMRVTTMVEKPTKEVAPSRLATIGRYVLTPQIFEALEKTQPGVGGEIQLTDALRILLTRQPIYAYEFEGTRYDAGDMVPWIITSITFALKRPDLGPQLRSYLKALDLS